MKYLNDHPLIGVNPDRSRYDGVLLPFEPNDLATILDETMARKRPHKSVTMAMASLTDGQVLYAVNDLFIGTKSHISARYEINLGDTSEVQSSSGIIVSTGLGSTGWMKSVVTGSAAINRALNSKAKAMTYKPRPWDADHLLFAVREPFPSKTSGTSLVFGTITHGQQLTLVSQMPENGVIFSDGIEADHMAFNSGLTANISIANRHGRLVI
jgi:hypothetical protein